MDSQCYCIKDSLSVRPKKPNGERIEHLKTAKQIKGIRAEEIAKQYLENAGLTLFQSNFLCKLGEIDLIMQEKETLVFVEVRYRHSVAHGTGAETIQYYKRLRIIRAAKFFLKSKKWTNTKPCRFDVVDLSGELSNPSIRWIKSAFTT